MEDESGKIINEIERGRDRERETEDEEEDVKIINEIKTFVEGHKNHLHYFLHQHPMYWCGLSVQYAKTVDSVIYCSGCSSTITDDMKFGCPKCKCFFHEECAERPKEITHPYHKSHPLTLVPHLARPRSERCLGCDLPLSGTSYGCITCSVYFHKFCLELPPLIKHFDFTYACDNTLVYKFHNLVLNHTGAAEVLKPRTAFSYVCDKCDFATSIPKWVSKTRGHILTLMPFPTEVTKRFHHLDVYFWYRFSDSEKICFICGEALRPLGFFFCEDCNLYLHVGCALPPTFKSDHHRHLLKLSDSNDHFCSTNTGYDDFYCNHCEKQLHPGLAVYKCPETDCNGFVAHCYCEFLQGDVSICHVPDYIEMGTERVVMVKHPAVTMQDVELKWVQELKSLDTDTYVEGKEKVKKLFKEEDFVGCSDFAEFMDASASEYIDILSEKRPYCFFGVVEEVGEYLVAKELAPILKGLFKRYGDFSAKSIILPEKARLFVFNYLCYAISQICTSKQINDGNLYLLLNSLKIAACARFEIQFAVELFKKAFLARTLDHLDSVDVQSVVSSDTDNGDLDSVDDQAMDELDRDIRRIMKEEVGQLSKPYVSYYSGSSKDVRITPVLTNPEGEPTVPALEIQYTPERRNSWFTYLKSLISKSILEKEERSVGGTEVNQMLLWDYQSVMNNINRFIEQHWTTTNVDIKTTTNFEVCCYGCELRTYNKGASYHKCTISTCRYRNILFQTNIPRYGLETYNILCHHDVTHFQEPPSDYGLDTMDYIVSTDRIIDSSSGLKWVNECCFVCGLPLWGTSYDCEKHGSFHKHCVQIPLEIQHFLHPLHSLVLRPNSEIGKQRCYVCGVNCRGCAFTCSDCSFFVEVQCVFRKETFKCESHEHLLTVIDATRNYHLLDCSTCEMTFEQPFYLYCGLCDYSYHAKCVLPSTITCSHRHPLTIVESHKPDDSNEFYCTACEERIKPKDPVYHCFECVEGNKYTAHIVCALLEGHSTSTQDSDCVTQVEGFGPSRGRGNTCRGRGRAPRSTRGRGNTLGRGRGNTLGRGRATRPCTMSIADNREPNDHPEALFTEKNLSDPIGQCSKSEGNRTDRRIRHFKKTCVSQAPRPQLM